MFLLNEIIDNPFESQLDIDELIHFQNNERDFYFHKGDHVYFNDYDLQSLFSFFRILKNCHENYSDFMNFDVLYNLNSVVHHQHIQLIVHDQYVEICLINVLLYCRYLF